MHKNRIRHARFDQFRADPGVIVRSFRLHGRVDTLEYAPAQLQQQREKYFFARVEVKVDYAFGYARRPGDFVGRGQGMQAAFEQAFERVHDGLFAVLFFRGVPRQLLLHNR